MSIKKTINKKNTLDTFSNKSNIDNFNIGFICDNLYVANQINDNDVNYILDLLVKNGSGWVAVGNDAFTSYKMPKIKQFITLCKNKGLKVHLRTGFSKSNMLKQTDGTQIVFSSGSISSKTEVANTNLTGKSNSSGTITDTTKNWVVDEWKGYQVYCKSVSNKDLVIYIIGNTNNTLSLSCPIDVSETDSVFSILGIDLIDTSQEYKISYQCANDNAFTNTSRGLYKYIADNARAGLEAGADSFSCSNEMINNIQFGVPGSIFENFQKYVQEQKNLVNYIKTTVPGYTEGYTVSEIFWQSGNWIDSGAIAPLDFLALTFYEQESTALHRIKELSDKFGANKIQLDEFSLNGAQLEILDRKVANNIQEYSSLFSNRIKFFKKLGLKNVFRWELLDYSGWNDETLGFGCLYIRNKQIQNAIPAFWFDSYKKNVNTYISNYSLHFSPQSKAVIVANTSSLNLNDSFTIQCKINTSSNENQTIIEKLGSYKLSIDNKKITFKVNIAGSEKLIIDSEQMGDNYGTDRWITVLVSYDSSSLRMFINGKLKSELTVAGDVDNSTNSINVGVVVNNNFSGSQARLQDIEITKECLYTSDYENSNKAPDSKRAVVRLATEQSTGLVIKDTSGNNNGAVSTVIKEQPYWTLGIRDQIIEEDKASEFWKKNLWTGYNIAGLEFGSNRGGVPGISYPDIIPKEYCQWAYKNGINSFRLPIAIARLLPSLGLDGKFTIDKVYSKIIKDFLKNCEDYGIKCFLDVHDFGKYPFIGFGGFTGVFNVPKQIQDPNSPNDPSKKIDNPAFFNLISNNYPINLSGENEITIKNSQQNDYSFETVIFGDTSNPLPPTNGYIFKTRIKPVKTKSNGVIANNVWEGVSLIFGYQNDDNYYEINWSDAAYQPSNNSAPLTLGIKKNGVRTDLAGNSLFLNPNLGSWTDFEIDFNQSSNGIITVKKDNIVLFSVASDTDIRTGQVGYRTSNSILKIQSYQLNVNGDITSAKDSTGEVRWGKSKGQSVYSLQMHKNIYYKLHKEFDSYNGLEGYMYNEPEGFGDEYTLAEQTKPSTYKTTAIVTLFQQAALDQLRQMGSTKWFGWTSDSFSGIQNMAIDTKPEVKWGSSFDYPWVDIIDKTFMDLHYYTDKYSNYPNFNYSHSGTYGSIGWNDNTNTWDSNSGSGNHEPFTREETIVHLNSFIKRHNEINKDRILAGKSPVPMIISELGAPYQLNKGALPNADYIKSLDTTLSILRANNVGFHYYAIGPTAPNVGDGLFADVRTVDSTYANVILDEGNDPRHLTIFKYLNR